jgi:hypothetical protein
MYDILQCAPVSEVVAELGVCRLTPSGRNPLGELKSGDVKIKGPLTTFATADQVHIEHMSNGRACLVRLTGQRRVNAGVYFDVEAYDTCDVLMLTSFAGLAIRLAGAENNTYVRVGVVVIYVRRGIVDDSSKSVVFEWSQKLTASDYPPPTLITLL